MSHQTTETTPRTGHTFTIAAGVAVVVCLVAASVALALKGWQTTEIVGLLTAVAAVAGPLVAAIGKLVDLREATDAQTVTLTKIDHQTNGVLAQKIRDETRAAVREVMSEPIALEPTNKDLS